MIKPDSTVFTFDGCCTAARIMGCATGVVKLLVFAANLVFALAGIGLITVGVLYKLHVTKVTDAIPPDYTGIELAPTLTIVVGAIIFLISFLGCCGALRSSSCLLTTYAVILLFIFIFKVALGVYAFLEIKDKATFNKKVDAKLTQVFNQYGTNNNITNEVVDVIQGELLNCCGLTGPEYWKESQHNRGITPDSCYSDSRHANVHKNGCLGAFRDFLDHSMNIIGITVLSISALEVVGSIFALCLANTIRNNERRGYY